MTDSARYGYYLRPSAAMCAAQVRMHTLLERQFALRVAGQFMPHCTVKGFFQSDATEPELRERAATISTGLAAFPVYSQGVIALGGRSIVLSIRDQPDGRKNEALQALHNRAVDVLLPLVSPNCPHTPRERLRDAFHAHLTLAMADIPSAHFDEILAFCQELEPIGPTVFTAEWLHLYRFDSDDWAGDWWQSFRWRLLDSWKIAS